MLKNYFQTALKNLLKHKLFSIINIVGLSIGLAACLLIILYVQNETSYDRHWQKAERIYRVTTTLQRQGSDPLTVSVGTAPLLPALLDDFAGEIETGFYSFLLVNTEVRINGTPLTQDIYTVGDGFLDVFELDVVDGNLEATLADASSIALSEETARARFGTTDVVGNVITLLLPTGDIDLRVGAVYRESAQSSVLEMPALRRLDPATVTGTWLGPFSWWAYVLLKDGVAPEQITAGLKDFIDRNVDVSGLRPAEGVKPSDLVSFDLQNIRDVYLHSPFDGLNGGAAVSGNRGSTTTVLAFSAIAALVLLIGCINFTVLSTSRAAQRAREVAMRKTVGADRAQLVVQFLGESLLVVLLALAVGVALTEIMLPAFSALVGRELAVVWSSPQIYLSMLGLWLAVSVIGGLYPAFVLSWFKPARILKANRSAALPGSLSLRNALVIFQFGTSIALMIATAVIYVQVEYATRHDPGYKAQNVLTISGLQSRDATVAANRTNLKLQISELPAVTHTSLSGHQPMQRFGNSTFTLQFTVAGTGDDPHPMSMLAIDADFFAAYEIPLLAGRSFDATRDRESTMLRFGQKFPEDERQSQIILNSSAARALGFAAPEAAIGQRLTTNSFANEQHTFTIVGIVPDTQFYTLRSEARQEAYIYDPLTADVLTVRYEGEAAPLVERINAIWSGITNRRLQLTFVGARLEDEFARERIEAQMLISFSLLAIIIACMGLYGSAAFAVDRRTKEIGIRKVMGAEVREIVGLLLWQFSKPVLIANVIAWPAGLWVMLTWLQRFPYQIDKLLLIPLCVMAGFAALSIAWITVGSTTARAANRNPVLALRYE